MTIDNRTELNDCDVNTGWAGDDTASPINVAGLFYQGTNALSTQLSNADEHMYTTEDTLNTGTFSIDMSDSTLYLIVKDNQQDSQANGGMKVVVGDGTNRIGIETNGFDNPGVLLSKLFYGMRADISNRTAFTLHTFAGVAANLSDTAITQIGYGSLHLAKAQGAVDNVFMDYFAYIANDSPALTINGGTSGTPETWTDVAGDDDTNGWGLVGNPLAAQFQIGCPFEIGDDTAATDSYFTMDGEQLYLLGDVFGATHFFWSLLGSTGTNQLVINNSQIISVSGTTGSPCDLTWTASAFNNLQIDNSLFVDVGNVTCPANSATRWFRATTFLGPTSITPNAMEFTDCVMAAGVNTSADGLLILDTAGDSNNMANISFVDDGAGHAIIITATGSYTFDNFTFTSGFTGTGTNAAVYNNSGGAVTIAVINGGDTPSVRNGAGASTTITNNQTITFDGVSRGTSLKIIAEQTVGTITRGDVILSAFADANGEATTSLNYEAAFNPDGLLVRAQARNQGIFCSCQVEDNGTGFTDETEDLNSGTASDVPVWPATPAVNDAIYFGHDAPFTRMKFVVGTARSGPTSLTTVWEYWNGLSWASVTVDEDGNVDWNTVGTYRYSITGSTTGWATTSVNSITGLYWIRNRITAITGAFTTVPALSRANHDGDRYLPFNAIRRFTSTGLLVTAAWTLDTISKFDPAD